jgi:response regulator RpfG family c-di-GMP phosphodiesterase
MKKIPIRILLVEDNPGDVRILQEYLLKDSLVHVDLDRVERLKTGLDHLTLGKPDVILLDLGLPDSQGLETFSQVHAFAPEVPIVVLTGLNDTEQAIEAMRAGAQDYLIKGEVNSSLLTRAIRYAIERKQAEHDLARKTDELNRLYKATGSLISIIPFNLQTLGQTIVSVILQEFGQANCSVFILQENSKELDRLAAGGPYADQVSKTLLLVDGIGLVPEAIRTGRVINTPDVRAIADYICGWEEARSELTIPLRIGEQTIGVIDVQSVELSAFNVDDERVMSIFAERAALAIEHARLFAQTEQRLQNLVSLRAIDQAISSSFDSRISLGILLEQVIKRLGIHAADILIFNPVAQSLKYSVGRGFRSKANQHTNIWLGDKYSGRAARERRTITIQNLEGNLSDFEKSTNLYHEDFISYMGIPLIAKGQIKGVLEIFQRDLLELNQEGKDFLDMLAGQAAIAIDNTELFDQLQSSNGELMMAYDETIEGWSRAMDLRDQDTEGHTRRVAEETLNLAIQMGFSANDMTHIRRGALLHDIGKIGVSDSILRKPGPLTEEEWRIMRTHPQLAYDMLSPIIYLRPAIDIPYCHHEKWDGSGYPRGLKGDEIPLAARTFAVVDVWDALVSDRPYRAAWPESKALAYIHEQAGKHFDPKVVDFFLHKEFDGIR